MVYTYNRILFSHKKWNSDTCYSMDEPCKYYIKEKKQVTMGQILSDPAYIKYLE